MTQRTYDLSDLICKLSHVLPAFTCASAISNLWSICLGVNILSCLWSESLAMWSKLFINPFTCFSFGNIKLSKVITIFCLPLRSIISA